MPARADHSHEASALRRLALRAGILPEYVDQTGRERRATTDDTRVALLDAMGLPAHTEREAARALEALEASEHEQLLPPVQVTTLAEPPALAARVPDGWAGAGVTCELEVTLEDGEVRAGVVRATAARDGTLAVPLPDGLTPGYHRVRLLARHGGDACEGALTLVVAPAHCPAPDHVRRWGLTVQLYAVRSARNWGVGNLGDLRELVAWTGAHGGSFVGLNPLHALRNRGADVSPYSPVSRLYRNPLYLELETLPELADAPEVQAMLRHPAREAQVEALRAAPRVDYARVSALVRPVLRALHRAFAAHHRGRATARGHAYAAYLAQQGRALDDFATFMALDDHHHGAGWHDWPEGHRDPRSVETRAFRAAHGEEVDFHKWCQFALDAQLAAAAATARGAGLGVGLYQDLAIGTATGGSDTWAFPTLFARGASLGAPPDAYAPAGQNWGLPPLQPHRLREQRYEYYIALLRAAFRHAGALRIDHILGLFRQFWVPEGCEGSAGAYVRFPTADLLGILALEAHRAGALVVGEDLGTVPPEVPPTLERWRILASRVLLFERDDEGFRPAAHYPALSLTTANTHDMPTLAGYWAGHDIALRREVGLLADEAAVETARAERERDRRALLDRLAAEGALPAPVAPASDAELRGAVHEFLCRTPAALVGISLDDLLGETEPVNVPGVGPERFPSWTRRLRLPIEQLHDDPGVDAALRCARGAARADR